MRTTTRDNTPSKEITKGELRKARRMLNMPLLIGTVVALAIVGPAAYFWHSRQLNRLAKDLVVEAGRFEEEGEFEKAADYYHRYLRVHPDDAVVWLSGDAADATPRDVNVRVLLARAFDEAATVPARKIQAIELYYEAIGREHDVLDAATLNELRCRLAELLLDMAPYPPAGRYVQAETEAKKLANDNAKGWRILALALYGQYRITALESRPAQETPSDPDAQSDKGSIGEAFDAMGKVPALAFERALKLNPTDVQLASSLAQIYREAEPLLSHQTQAFAASEREQLADDVMDRLVAANPRDTEVYLARYQYRIQYGHETSLARDDLRAALEHGPDNVPALLLSAASEMQEAAKAQAQGASTEQIEDHLDGAATHYQHTIKIAPDDARAYLGMSQIDYSRREPGGAVAWLEQGLLACDKDNVSLNRALAELLVTYGRIDTIDRLSAAERVGLEGLLAEDSLGLDEGRQQRLADALAGWLRGKVRTLSPENRTELAGLLAEERWGLSTASQTQLAVSLFRWLTIQPIESIESLDRVFAANSATMSPSQRIEFRRTNDLLRAKWSVQTRDFRRAVPLLRGVTLGQVTSASETAQVYQAWLLLGDVFSAMGQWDQAGTAYDEAVRLDPRSARPRRASAAAWAKAGQLDVASRMYEQALAIEETADTWLALAQVQLRQQLINAPDARDWAPLEKSLAQATALSESDPLTQPWQLPLLKAEVALARAKETGQPERGIEEAAQLLRQAETDYSDSAELLLTLVVAYERTGHPDDADRALNQLAELPNQAGNARLLRSQLFCGRKEYAAARRVLRGDSDNPPKDRAAALKYAEVQVSLAEGDVDRATKELAALFDADPSNALFARQLAELALQEADLAAAARWEEKVRKLEGEADSFWRYYRARRLLVEAKSVDDSRFAEAVELHTDLQGQRPRWSATHLLEGLIWERRENAQRAIEAYQEAVRLGETRITVFERLITLLNGMRRFTEADQYLARLKEQVPTSQSLTALEMSAAAGLGQTDRAVEAARRGVARRPQDADARLWLGQMLLLAGETDEAEEAFAEGVRLAPTNLAAHSGLMNFYLRVERLDDARATLEKMARLESLSDVQRALLLGQGYELIGDEEAAAEQYHTAQELAPDNVNVQGRVASFLLRTDVVEAEETLRHLIEISPQAAGARRALAAILAARGGEQEWEEARQLLEQPGADISTLDRRLQAVLLARRGGKDNRQRARELLEQLVSDPKTTTPGDRLLLARIYEAEDRVLAARQEYLALVGQDDPDLSHVALYADMLIRNELWDEAQGWLATLRKEAPDDLGVLTLQVRWLAGQDRVAEIEPLVEATAKRLLGILQEEALDQTEREAQLCLSIGNVYSAVDRHALSERWYRRLMELMPRRYEPLASSLSRLDRMPEAIDLCVEAATNDDSPRPALVLASLLVSGKPTPEDFALAEPLLAEAAEAFEDNATLLTSLANVRIIQEMPDEAVRLYRQVVKLNPKDVVALNNLATLLSEQSGTTDESLQYIDRAIRIAGPQSSLLDTKGTALIHAGRPSEAIPLLEEAASMVGADPRYSFHLAIAYYELGEMAKAGEAFETAQASELAGTLLTPSDQEYLDKLERQFGP